MARTRLILAAGLAGAFAVAAPVVAATDNPKPGGSKGRAEKACDAQGRKITFAGPTAIWPPNHKFADPATLTAVGIAGVDQTTEISSVVRSDEVLPDGTELNGSGTTPVDSDPVVATGSGKDTASTRQAVRAERSGRGDGRAYTYVVTAKFNQVMSCTAEFLVTVPHDMRVENRG